MNAACWSADGSTLLFTTNTESQIFCLKFLPNIVENYGAGSDEDINGLKMDRAEPTLQSSGAAVPVMDLAKVTFNCEDGEEIRYEWQESMLTL